MITRCRPLLGTFVEITAPEEAGPAIDLAFAVIRHVHERMSFHEPESDLARLRAAIPGELVGVDPETVEVLRLAIDFHEATDGLFEIAVGRELVQSGFLPRDGVDNLNHFLGNSHDIEIIDDRHVRFKRRLLIDLGGIAKGYAVDRAVETLIAAGVTHGLVNAGGDLRAFGDRDWPIRLRDADGAVRQEVRLRNGAIASSENLSTRRRYRHRICTPHFGRDRRPVLVNARVSVVAERCVVADAMTKIAMVDMGLAEAILTGHCGQVLRDPVAAGGA